MGQSFLGARVYWKSGNKGGIVVSDFWLLTCSGGQKPYVCVHRSHPGHRTEFVPADDAEAEYIRSGGCVRSGMETGLAE